MAFTDAKRAIKNAPFRTTWVFRDANGNILTSVTSITANVAKDTCNPATAANAPAAQTGNQLYYLDLTATEMAADILEVLVTGSGANAHYRVIETEPALDSGVVAAATIGSVTLASTAMALADYYNGAMIEIVRGTGAGQVRTITDYSSGLVATIDRDWSSSAQPDTTSVYIIHPRTGTPLTTVGASMYSQSDIKSINGDTTAAANAEKLYEGAFISSSVNDATPSTTSFDGAAGLSATDDFYNSMFLVFTSGTLKGIPRKITDYVASTRTFTTSAFPVAPSNGDTFIIIAREE